MRRTAVLSVAVVAWVSAIVAPALASETRPWTRVASGGMNISDQVGLARTADGVLHVAWRRQGAAQDLLETPIAPSGTVGAAVTVASGWAGIGSPAMVAQGSALSAFFPGTRTLTTGDPTEGLDLASSSDGGASWSVSPTAIAQGDFAFARTPSAILTASGSYLQSWYGADSTVVHPGLDRNVPAVSGYGMGTDQGLATAADGQVMVAWCGSTGVSAAQVDPATGARIGDVVALADTGRCPADTRVAIASFRDVRREDGSGQPYFYVAASSASGSTVRVYAIAGGKAVGALTASKGSSFKQEIAVAAAPHGRVWVGWRDSDSGDLVFRRSSSGGTRFGAAVSMPVPAGQSVSQLALDAQDDRADAVATGSDADNVVDLSATQVFPGLTLKAGSGKRLAEKGFRVLDAGDPVSGATVKVHGRRLTTNSGGYAKIRLRPGSYKVTASKHDYVDASRHIHVH
jgi:hypothetical protein